MTGKNGKSFMINQSVEQQFRHYARTGGTPVAIGGKHRADWERLWNSVLDDEDVQGVLRQMLFIPNRVPDWLQGKRLIAILDHLHGEATNLSLYDDVVQTLAEIVAVQVKYDSEGPSYYVTYSFVDVSDEPRHFTHEYGYDAYHAAVGGWGKQQLDQYWKVGNQIPCHFRSSSPENHYLCEP